jgi:hypothetical protein
VNAARTLGVGATLIYFVIVSDSFGESGGVVWVARARFVTTGRYAFSPRNILSKNVLIDEITEALIEDE